MNSKNNKLSSAPLTMTAAVEVLSNIADLGNANEEEIDSLSSHPLGEDPLKIAKETFGTILHCLKQIYAAKYSSLNDTETAAGIRTIMVLVEEAAKNLDKYIHFFPQEAELASVLELKEYRRLQHFYLNNMAPRLDERKLGHWILELSKQALTNQRDLLLLEKESSKITTKHVFVDLDAISKDLEYELFFMRKEDGTRFFNPRLIRNIKLVSDCSGHFRYGEEGNPLARLELWLDGFTQKTARDMVTHLKPIIDAFLRESIHHKGKELVKILNQSIMALLLSASSHHLNSRHPLKNCLAYFSDFQVFLGKVLCSNEYQKLIAYPPRLTNHIGNSLKKTAMALCRAIYLYGHGLQVMRPLILKLIAEGENGEQVATETMPISNKLMRSYHTLEGNLHKYANGPLTRLIESIMEGKNQNFNPLSQFNLPTQMYVLYVGDKRVLYTRMASPTSQEYIHKAVVNDEFKGFLLSCAQGHTVKKHLCVVLQDRTSWRETARCRALEALHHHRDFGQYLDVAVLAVDTDFYKQKEPYHHEHHMDVFKKHLLEQFCDDMSGFWFPATMQAALFRSFFPAIIERVHALFFSNKNILSSEHRMAFIDLCYLFTVFKLIELSDADVFSLACKDGIDTGPMLGSSIFMFYYLLKPNGQQSDFETYLNLQLFGPALMWRERTLSSERFQRLIRLTRVIETRRAELGENAFTKEVSAIFAKLYQWPWLEGEMSWPTA